MHLLTRCLVVSGQLSTISALCWSTGQRNWWGLFCLFTADPSGACGHQTHNALVLRPVSTVVARPSRRSFSSVLTSDSSRASRRGSLPFCHFSVDSSRLVYFSDLFRQFLARCTAVAVELDALVCHSWIWWSSLPLLGFATPAQDLKSRSGSS